MGTQSTWGLRAAQETSKMLNTHDTHHDKLVHCSFFSHIQNWSKISSHEALVAAYMTRHSFPSDVYTFIEEHKTSLSSTTILLCTVTMFLICHSPRLFLSVYEAAMINSILHCQSKRLGITPIWYLYAMASVQLLQVINTSLNFPIYWFVGNFRETFINLFRLNKFRTNP